MNWVENLQSQKFILILVFVHTLEVLFEIIQAGPGLVRLCAVLGETLVVFCETVIDKMYRLQVSIQVV